MKKSISFILTLLIVLFSNKVSAQLAQDSWGIGFGGTYPRLVSTNITSSSLGYGGYLSLIRDFSEHTGLRFYGKYSHLEGEWGAAQTTTIESFFGGVDFTFRFVPCEPVTPYFSVGAGGNYYMLDNAQTARLNDNFLDLTLTGSFGILWRLGDDWNLTTEFSYLSVDGSKFDGNDALSPGGGILGGVTDSYMTFDLGFLYYFGKGAPSRICQLYSGLSVESPDNVDYERIENIVKKHIPKEVVKEVVVEKPVSSEKKWILVGVNFDYNSTKLSSEAYPILFHAVQVLLQNPDMKVEIQGHTDNIGSDQANLKLSERRAQAIKNYLVARGVDGTRLKVVGYGEAYPIADNKTADGRAMNRRIEFKVLN